MIHTFDNGVKVFAKHLLPLQRKRYQKRNLHEPIEETWFLKIIDRSTGLFVDVGAGIGYYSILAKKVKPKFKTVAYEPSHVHFGRMLENIKLNNIAYIDVVEKAISDRNGTHKFKENLFGSTLSKTGAIKVATTRLDNEYDEIDVCKVDVQGHELAVLKGSTGCVVHNWIIGTHGPNRHRNCLAWLKKKHRIIFQNHSVLGQPDGIIVASR